MMPPVCPLSASLLAFAGFARIYFSVFRYRRRCRPFSRPCPPSFIFIFDFFQPEFSTVIFATSDLPGLLPSFFPRLRHRLPSISRHIAIPSCLPADGCHARTVAFSLSARRFSRFTLLISLAVFRMMLVFPPSLAARSPLLAGLLDGFAHFASVFFHSSRRFSSSFCHHATSTFSELMPPRRNAAARCRRKKRCPRQRFAVCSRGAGRRHTPPSRQRFAAQLARRCSATACRRRSPLIALFRRRAARQRYR
jgi:hypothetical protein